MVRGRARDHCRPAPPRRHLADLGAADCFGGGAITILTARSDVETLGWLGYAVIAVAAVVITRIKLHPPAVPLLVLALGLALLPVRKLFYDDSGIAAAAIGMTLLFGEARSRWRSSAAALVDGLACAGFAAPVLVMRWVAPGLLGVGAWGMLQAALAAGPLALVFIRRATPGRTRRSDAVAPAGPDRHRLAHACGL
jgi:hypothetical protein